MGFSMDTDLIGTGSPWTPALIGDRFARIGACGRSFGRGLLRFHDTDSAADAQETVDSMWPELGSDFAVLAFDWLGRQFTVVGAAHSETGADDVVLLDPSGHTSESLVEPADFLPAFETPLMLEVLEAPLFGDWLVAQSLSGLSFTDCAGCRIPGFLGGPLTVGNLELTDLSVHLSVLEQIWAQTAAAPTGSSVTGFDIGGRR